MKTLLTWLLFAGFLAVFATGCHAQAIDDHAEHQIEAIHADTRSLLVDASCPDGAVLHAECGLLTQRVAMQDFRDTFAQKKCADATAEACQERFDRAIDEWLVQRYMLANVDLVRARCERTEDRCADGREYELLLMQSHNRVVMDVGERRVSSAIEEREMKLAVDRVNTMDAALTGLTVVAVLASAGSHHRFHHHHW